MDPEFALLALALGAVVHLISISAIIFKLGQIHADFKATVKAVEDHEARLRVVERHTLITT